MSEHAEHITCAEFVRLVSSYLERVLTSAETSLVEEHVNFCDGCGRYLDQMDRTIRLASLLRTDDVAPELREALMDAFRTWEAP